MTARSIRRAAERKARKAAEKQARLQQLAAREDEPAFSQRGEDSINRPAERKARKTAEKETRLQQCMTQQDEPASYQCGEDSSNRPADEQARLQQPTETESVSEARLAANRANAQLSTGARTPQGKATSSMNAVKTGLTGRTVLLPSDDAEAYQRHLIAYENEFQPVGLRERELVQSLADIQWRLQRIPGLEMAIYARGREEFAAQFEELDPEVRSARIDLETFIHYQKPLRNLQIQEGRLQRQRAKDMAELRELQEERRQAEQPQTVPARMSIPAGEPDMAFFNRLLDRATAPNPDPSAVAVLKQFGFDISAPAS
jgi:hypothetical protein